MVIPTMRSVHCATLDNLSMLYHLPSAVILYQDDHCTVIVVLVAIISCRKHCQELPVSKVFISMLYTLVSTDNKLEAISTVEILHTVWPKSTSVLSARRDVNAEDAVVVSGVRPQRI